MQGSCNENWILNLFENQNGRQLRRLGHRWENSIKMDLTIIRWEGVECIHLAQQRWQWWSCVHAVINIHVLWKAENPTSCALNNLHMDTTAWMVRGERGRDCDKRSYERHRKKTVHLVKKRQLPKYFCTEYNSSTKTNNSIFWTYYVLLIMCISTDASMQYTHRNRMSHHKKGMDSRT